MDNVERAIGSNVSADCQRRDGVARMRIALHRHGRRLDPQGLQAFQSLPEHGVHAERGVDQVDLAARPRQAAAQVNDVPRSPAAVASVTSRMRRPRP